MVKKDTFCIQVTPDVFNDKGSKNERQNVKVSKNC